MRSLRFLLPLLWGAFVCWAEKSLFGSFADSMLDTVWVFLWPFVFGVLLCIASTASPWGFRFRWYSVFPLLLTAGYLVVRFYPLPIPQMIMDYLTGREATLLLMLFCGFFTMRTMLTIRGES